MDTGVDVRSGAAFLVSITATGSSTNAAGGHLVGPAGYGSLLLPNAVAPDLPFGSLIGRLNGRIFEIGEQLGKRPPDSGRLYLAMNDVPGTYGDNSGQVTVVISQRVNPAVVEFKDPLMAMELLSPDPTPFYVSPVFRWSIKNRVRAPISGYVQVLLDGASASINPVPIVTGLTANAELDGTFTIFTGANPHLDAGQHEVRMQLRDNTASHALLGELVAYVTAYVPTPAPTIAIQLFKADPDYQNQGSTSKLSWTLQPNGTCLPAALRLTKKDVGKPDVVVMETNGSVGNIIPDSATLRGTIRSYSPKVRDKLLSGVRRTANAAAVMAGALEPDVAISQNGASVINSDTVVARIEPALVATLGSKNVQRAPPITASEDFSAFVNESVPSMFFFIGVYSPARVEASMKPGGEPLPSNHSPQFAPVPEPSIKTGVQAMSLAVLTMLTAR
jgi:hypothetical protein